MQKKTKKILNLVQISHLNYIARNLNRITGFQGEELSIWKEVEDIVEAMTDQPRRDSVYTKREANKISTSGISTFLTGLGGRGNYWNPSERIPLPGYAVGTFNRLARKHPVRFLLRIEGTGGIDAGFSLGDDSEGILCALWMSYFHDEGWKHLKKCPQCKKWFVDDTKSLKKERCTKSCSDKWWSREFRKETKPKFQTCQKCKGKFFLRFRVKGKEEKRESCPHCEFEIDPKKRKLERIKCEVFPLNKHLYNNELCKCEKGEMPDPSKICEVKCDHYKKSKIAQKWGRIKREENDLPRLKTKSRKQGKK